MPDEKPVEEGYTDFGYVGPDGVLYSTESEAIEANQLEEE